MMKKLLAFSALCALTLAFGVLAFGPQAFAGPVKTAADVPDLVLPVEVDCYAVGEQIAQQNGGTVAKAVPVTQDGQAMCRIVLLIPGAEGERPRREEILVPQ
jgi:hypothetical protein